MLICCGSCPSYRRSTALFSYYPTPARPSMQARRSGRLMTLLDAIMTTEAKLNLATTYLLTAESRPVLGLVFARNL